MTTINMLQHRFKARESTERDKALAARGEGGGSHGGTPQGVQSGLVVPREHSVDRCPTDTEG